MKCPNCTKPVRPEWKLCIYCGYELKGSANSRAERAGTRERESGRADRYDDDDYDEQGRDDDDDGGERRGVGEQPASRGGRTSARGRGRSPDWDEQPSGTEDSIEAPVHPPRDRDGRAAGPTRSGRGYNEDDEEHEEDGAYDDRWSRSPRPPQRRGDDRDLRDEQQDRGSRPRSNRFDDPLDDPRAPGFLRGSAAPRAAGWPGSSTRNGRGSGYDEPGGGRRPPNTPSRQGRQDYPDDRRGYGSSSRTPPRRMPEPRAPDPLEDSWGMSAFSVKEHAAGWTDPSAAWGAAPSAEYSAAQPGYRGPSGGRNSRSGSSARSGRGDARARGGARGKFVALGVLLALLLVGGGVLVAPKLLGKGNPSSVTLPSAFATYTPGPTPTPAANFTLFTSKRSAYILTYPQDWSVTQQPASGGDNLDVFAGQGGLPMYRVEQATGFAGVSDDDVIAGEVQGAKTIDSSATYTENLSAATTSAIGGEQWTRREFDVSSAGAKYHMAILSCHHHGKGYVIVLVTAPADFAKYSSGAFKTMLASFRFVD